MTRASQQLSVCRHVIARRPAVLLGGSVVCAGGGLRVQAGLARHAVEGVGAGVVVV